MTISWFSSVWKYLKKPWGCLNCTWDCLKVLKKPWVCLNCVRQGVLALWRRWSSRGWSGLFLWYIRDVHVYVYLGIGQITFWSQKIKKRMAEVRSAHSYHVLTKGAPLNQHPSKISLFSWMMKIGANWWSFGNHYPEIRWVSGSWIAFDPTAEDRISWVQCII